MASLKEKLQKQKAKDKKKISVVRKKKSVDEVDPIISAATEMPKMKVKPKVPYKVPNIKMVDQQSKTEVSLREDFRKILGDEYDAPKAFGVFTTEIGPTLVEDIGERPQVLEDMWENLDPARKREYALKVLKSRDVWGLSKVIDQLLTMSVDLQEDFMTKYTEENQDLDHAKFLKRWMESPMVADQIREYQVLQVLNQSEKVDKRETIIRVLKNRALQYAESKELVVDPDDPYVSILVSMKGRDRYQKLHVKLASDYIELAKVLGSEDAEELTPSDLITYIEKEKRRLYGSVDQQIVEKIVSSPRKKLEKEAQKLMLEVDDIPDDILRVKILQKQRDMSRVPMTDEDLLDEALRLGIKDAENLERWHLYSRVKAASVVGRASAKKEGSSMERSLLAEKLCRITGKDPDFFKDWSYEELTQRYQAIEQGDEYWEEFDRENVIDQLVNSTGKHRSKFDSRTADDLVNELENLKESRIASKKLASETQYAQKCVRLFKSYKWLKAVVTGVWISSEPEDIKEYASKSYVNCPGVGKMYRANIRFYNLQCGKYASERFQNGSYLTCYDSSHRPVTFKVAYSVQTPTSYRSWPILNASDEFGRSTMKYRSNRLVVQTEDIFQDELKYMTHERRDRDTKKRDLLRQEVDEKTIGIVKKFLSRELLNVAPSVKDYEVTSPYIQIAVNSVVRPGMTNSELFYAVADLTSFLKNRTAKIFRARVQAEYYLPDALMILSIEDKLPEVFDPYYNVSEKTKQSYASYLDTSRSKTVDAMTSNLIFVMDPSVKWPMRPTLAEFPAPEIEYDSSVCVNSKDSIAPENLVYFRDRDDSKVYCLDVDSISKQFREGDYQNHLSGKLFPKNFIRRYTVTYYDADTNKEYTYPYEKLHKRFKAGKYNIPELNRPFSKSFVNSILKDPNWKKSAHLRSLQFARMDRRVAHCVNPEDVENAPIEAVVYYKDPEDESLYCFTISRMSNMLSNDGINPYTGRKFSKSFSRKFTKMYSDSLHTKGINQPEFRELYDEDIFKDIPLEKENQEEVVPVQKLVIPDLWDMLTSTLIKKSIIPAEDNREEHLRVLKLDADATDEDINESYTRLSEKYAKKPEKRKVIEQAYSALMRDDDVTTEDTETDTTTKEDDTSTEDTNTQSSSQEEVEEPKKQSKKAKGKNQEEEPKKQSKMGMGPKKDKGKTETCCYCKGQIGDSQIRSVVMKSGTPELCNFCCLECMEKFNFGRYKK